MQSAGLTDILLEALNVADITLKYMVGRVGSPLRLTYSRCRFKNLGAFAPVKGESCLVVFAIGYMINSYMQLHFLFHIQCMRSKLGNSLIKKLSFGIGDRINYKG